MAYLGRGLDKISNIEVLDNITFDGSSSYSITKGSVAFTPNSAQSCLISIDGVVQATNFTVSSSTINFGVAVPSTSTCNFFLHYGTGVMTVPSDGSVTTAKLGDGAVTSAKLASGTGGKVLQVVQTVKTDTQTISTASLTEISGLTAALTCSSTSNKVLITGQLSAGGTTNDAGYTLYAGTTAIGIGDAASNRRRTTFGGGAFLGQGSEQYRLYTIPFCFLYSPSSTSAITYSIKKSDSGATATYINRSAQDGDNADRQRGISTITVMEVAG